MLSAIIRPRLTDYYDIPVTQEKVSFAIPFLDEDIPLFLDPFLLWKSPSQQDNALHDTILNCFNHLGMQYLKGNQTEIIDILKAMSECSEVGLGSGQTKKGLRISTATAKEILELFKDIPQINQNGFKHFELIQLYVSQISKDRISDIGCNLLKSFLIDYTQNECQRYTIPMDKTHSIPVYNSRNHKLCKEDVALPYNPENNEPILLVPKRWLRYMPWINFEDYFSNSFVKEGTEEQLERPEVLNYNRYNYDAVETYVVNKESTFEQCKNDPLFKQIPVVSAKKALSAILKLPTGKTDNADQQFERKSAKLLASVLYPHMDFAQEQSRIESGTQIRDLIFYNGCSLPFLDDIYRTYEAKQIVIEMKNVREVTRDHINQLNRYLTSNFGRFGILLTRNPLKQNIFRNTVDLWAGQRKCIICLTDEDVKMMVDVYESKQRNPIDVINKKIC